METKNIKQPESDYRTLQEELERRYGPGLAQDITEQIRKTESPGVIPEYMQVKAASEVVEVFRAETRNALHKLKSCRKQVAVNDDAVISLENERIRHEYERLYDLYFQAQRGFYRLYKKAMSACTEEAPATRRYRKTVHEQEMALAG
jgi:hypothetical protein